MALVRDIYQGRDMARIMSFVMAVFALVPALAPTLGHFIILGFGWRAIFAAFILFSLITVLWPALWGFAAYEFDSGPGEIAIIGLAWSLPAAYKPPMGCPSPLRTRDFGSVLSPANVPKLPGSTLTA